MGRVYLSLGYDTEKPTGMVNTKKGKEALKRKLAFMKEKLVETLDNLDAPRTFFILGYHMKDSLRVFPKTTLREIFNKDNPLTEIQQHTYTHLIFREIDGRPVSTPEEFYEDVKKANQLITKVLGVTPNALRTPLGYPEDLSDMPEILEGLKLLGFQYVSSELRSYESPIKGPLNHDKQPHRYENVGYPDIVEIPSHGWQDVIFLREYAELFNEKIRTPDEIVEHYIGLFNKAEKMANEKSPVFVSLCLHPFAVMEYDPQMEIHKRIIDAAREKKIRLLTYGEVAERI